MSAPPSSAKQSYDALRTAHVELERETQQRRQSEALYRVFYQLAVQAAQGDSLYDFCAKVHELIGAAHGGSLLLYQPRLTWSATSRTTRMTCTLRTTCFSRSENVPMRLGSDRICVRHRAAPTRRPGPYGRNSNAMDW